MEFDKAIFFYNYLKTGIETFYGIIEHKTLGEVQIGGTIVTFTYEDFERYYHDFKSEMRLNSIEIQNAELIFEYVADNFQDILNWTGFEENINRIMVSGRFEVNYLKELKLNIEIYASKIKKMGVCNKFGCPSEEFQDMIYWYVNNPDNDNDDIPFEHETSIITKGVIDYDFIVSYNFEEVQYESTKIEKTVDKIFLFEERLKNYRILKKKSQKDRNDKKLLDQDKDFETLCEIEIEGLKRKLDLELKTSAFTVTNLPEKTYKNNFRGSLQWTASDTDLIELITALYYKQTIKQLDGRKLSRKNLLDYFQQIFGLEIKDVEGKLSRATNRKINKTPFLDSLKVAFESYSEEKSEK